MPKQLETRELALAAFLRAKGHNPSLDVSDSSGFVTFRFADADGALDRLASDFLQGAEVSALRFFHALNDLRSAIRFVQRGRR